MAKTKISEFSTTAGNNTDINSINIAEGCSPSGINDAIRELMRQLKEFQTGGAGDSVNSGGDFSVATNKFTVASASGNTSVAGTLEVTGTTTLTGALVANGNATLGDASGDTVTIKGTPTLEVNPTLSGGTANGVLYLNGSKVATSGSALTFDGTTLSNTGSGDRAKFGTGSRNIYISGDSNGVSLLDGAGQTGNGWYINGASSYVAGYIGSSEAMRLTSTGLGVGTSSPNSKIDAYYASTPIGATTWGTAATLRAGTGSFAFTGANNRGIGTLVHTNQNSNTTLPYGGDYEVFGLLSAANSAVGGGYGVYGVAAYSRSDGNAYALRADAVNTAGTSGTRAFGLYVGSVTGAESNYGIYVNDTSAKNYIGGDLLVGTTSQIASARSVITGDSGNAQVIYFNNTRNNGTGDATAISLLGSSDNNTSNYHYIGTTGGTDRVYIFGNGNIQNTNNSYGAISDSKLKENIVDASPKLADMMQVRIRNYNLIGETQKQIGVVAQELETVFPGMIDETPDRDAEGNDLGTTTKSVKYSVFVPMLIKAIQELKAEFDAYKASHP